jgi:hypothetical protein
MEHDLFVDMICSLFSWSCSMAILDYHGGYVTDLNFPPDPMDLEGTIRLKRPNKYPSRMYA